MVGVGDLARRACWEGTWSIEANDETMGFTNVLIRAREKYPTLF